MKILSVLLLIFTPLVIGILMGPVLDLLINKIINLGRLLKQKGSD